MGRGEGPEKIIINVIAKAMAPSNLGYGLLPEGGQNHGRTKFQTP
jgi:hypothetical protein